MQETTHAVLKSGAEIPARQDWIDDFADRMQSTIERAYSSAGDSSEAFADFLHGKWLGHPLHPVLTDLPIGFWNSALALDMLDMFGARKLRAGADAMLALGLAGALGAAISRMTDWQHTAGKARRIGATHAALNSAAALLNAGSLLLRMSGRRSRAKALFMAGMGVATYSAYLGGNLVFDQKVGVNRAPKGAGPSEFTPIMPLDELPEGPPTRANVQGVELMLLRRDGHVSALANSCAHMGGPLSEGEVEGDCIVCPWHGSHFRLDDGRIESGPSVFDQPYFETRVVAGQVEVRRSEAAR